MSTGERNRDAREAYTSRQTCNCKDDYTGLHGHHRGACTRTLSLGIGVQVPETRMLLERQHDVKGCKHVLTNREEHA